MGLEYLNAGLVLHVLNEQSESHELNSPDKWWANCNRNKKEIWNGDLIQNFRSNNCVFTGQNYKEALKNRVKTGRLALQEGFQKETEAEVVQHTGSQDNNNLSDIVVDKT
jgi:hypothetical protein